MNKFEQASSDDHQMSLAVGSRPDVQLSGGVGGGCRLYSEVRYIMGNGCMGTPPRGKIRKYGKRLALKDD